MTWPWPLNLIERFARFLSNIPNALLTGAGGVALATTLLAAAFVERKDVAVAVAIAGTFIGTALLSFFLPKLLYTMREEEMKQAATQASAAEKLAEEERRTMQAEQRLADAKRELERLESMRINLDSFRSVQKLGLIEIDMHITHFDRKKLVFKEGNIFKSDQEHTYAGVIELPIHAQL